MSLLASLFFTWGFITVINNTLLPHLRSVFELNYTQTTLIESVWFIAYFVASIPSARLIERIGYKKSLVVGLSIMALGALMMIPAARLPSYIVTLVALFVIACGITLLQVAANPYVAVVGTPQTASARLNLVQAFNSLGTMFAPLFGGYLILGRSNSGTADAGHVLTQAERSTMIRSALTTALRRWLAMMALRSAPLWWPARRSSSRCSRMRVSVPVSTADRASSSSSSESAACSTSARLAVSRASAMFSAMVAENRKDSCGTQLMAPRKARKVYWSSVWAPQRTVPCCGVSWRSSTRSKVDLPLPLLAAVDEILTITPFTPLRWNEASAARQQSISPSTLTWN
eukprot:gene18813-21409_t